MAETRYYDCPNCGERVIGYRKTDNGEIGAKTLIGGGLAILGGALAGPLGVMAGLAGAKFLGDKMDKLDSEVKFVFKCPRCGEKFEKYLPH